MVESEALSLCQQHQHRYVMVHMQDGSMHDGIVESTDGEYVYLAVPNCGTEEDMSRAFLPGYGFGFGYPYGFGYPRRRFVRRAFPLFALLGLSLLPYY